MDKKSGVYYYLTDNSIRPSGSSNFGGAVLMFTSKGPIGEMITVTASNREEKLGVAMVGDDFDMTSEYMGLDAMLSAVARLDVLRMNVDPLVGYAAYGKDGVRLDEDDLGGVTSGGDFESLIDGDELSGFFAVHKDPGYWGDRAIKISRAEKKADQNDADVPYVLEYFEVDGVRNTRLQRNEFVLGADGTFAGGFGEILFHVDDKTILEKVMSVPVEKDEDDGYDSDGNPKTKKVVVGHETAILYFVAGSNGAYDELNASKLKRQLAPLELTGANVVVMNGITEDAGHISSVIEFCEKLDQSVLFDVESVGRDGPVSAQECIDWMSNVGSSQYAQGVALRDVKKIPGYGEAVIYPSVFLFMVYANMFRNYGHVCYPPAGPYASVSASNMEKSDFHLWGDDLKTARINYLAKTPQGICIFEQRTKYSLGGSDLSYANTVYILRDLKGRILDFMNNFTFRYATPSDLGIIQSGLSLILSGFVRNGFLVNYKLEVPSYAEAQAAGRELDINIGVSVVSDMEVINLRVGLYSAAELRA